MPATATDRLFGLTTSVAVKPACVAASTVNLTLSGIQTVGGVALASGDRVLVKDQTDTTQNGIWVASSGAWIRAADFDGARDVVKGTLVVASGDTNIYYRVTTANPVMIGSSAITFETVGASFTSASIGQTLDSLKRTAAEIAAGVTPVNYAYLPGYVDRYGTNTTPGTTDMTAAFTAAFKVAKTSGHSVRYGATWPYLLTGPVDATTDNGAPTYSFSVINEGNTGATTNNSPTYPSIIVTAPGQGTNDGHVFDCSGSQGITWRDVTVGTLAGGTAPKTCWFLARNSGGGGSIHRFENCRVFGTFTEAIAYDYGAEDEMWIGCQFVNYQPSGSATAKVIRWTAHNDRSLSSTFITIATGEQSTIDHQVIGGVFHNWNGNSSADAFYIDHCRDFKIIGPWMDCADNTGSKARSLIYIDSTHGASTDGFVTGVTGEAAPTCPDYGIRFGNEAVATPSYWHIVGNNFPNSTAMIAAGSNITCLGFTLQGNQNSSIGGGVVISGTLVSSYCDDPPGGFTVGALGENNVTPLSTVISSPSGESSITLRNASAPSGRRNFKLRSNGISAQLSFADNSNTVVANAAEISFDGAVVSQFDIGATNITLQGKCGFQGTAAIAKPTVTGSRGGNAALASVLTALANYGLITDSST